METEPQRSTYLPIALVVDDEPLIRMDTADMVADEGFAVVEARTAEEAFRYLEDQPMLLKWLTARSVRALPDALSTMGGHRVDGPNVAAAASLWPDHLGIGRPK